MRIMENGVPVLVLNIKNDLKRCDLTIKKSIRRSDIVWANGNPTFLFQVSGVDLEGREHTYVREAEFTREYEIRTAQRKGSFHWKQFFIISLVEEIIPFLRWRQIVMCWKK